MFNSIVTLIVIGNMWYIQDRDQPVYGKLTGLNVDGFSRMLASIYTYALLLLVLLATDLPLFTEEWLERRAVGAVAGETTWISCLGIRSGHGSCPSISR